MTMIVALMLMAFSYGLILLLLLVAKAVLGPLLAAHPATSEEIDAEVRALYGPGRPAWDAAATPGHTSEDIDAEVEALYGPYPAPAGSGDYHAYQD